MQLTTELTVYDPTVIGQQYRFTTPYDRFPAPVRSTANEI